MNMDNQDVCVVVPMHNEAGVIHQVLHELRGTFARIVCVDDGSTDDCARIAAAMGASVVRHPVNLGQGAALQTGFDWALQRPEIGYLVTFDADGQHRVVDAVAMLEHARRTGANVVLGSRFLHASGAEQVPRSRRLVLRAAVAFTRLTAGIRVSDTHNGLRVLDREAASRMSITMAGMAHASEMLFQVAQLGLRFVEHPVTVEYTTYSKAKGQSNLNAVNIAFDVIAHRLRSER